MRLRRNRNPGNETLSGCHSSWAKASLRDIINHIKKESPAAAVKVREELMKVARSLNESPERFSREEWLKDKPGDYRSVARWHYKILTTEVVILRFIHTSRSPELMGKSIDG